MLKSTSWPELLILISPQPSKQSTSQLSDTGPGNWLTQKDNTSDIDYFENFTLLDIVTPGDQASELQEEEGEQPPAKTLAEQQPVPVKEATTDSPPVSEDSFVMVTDVEIVGEHLDEVFYGEGPSTDMLRQREEEEGKARMRTRRESQRSAKESGSVLFSCEETTLTPIFISPGPPKIIDPILLEEPTAMSFMYSDLYEDAVGERRRSDEEHSEAESVASEKFCKRRFSDSEEADGYLEKFTLKDETPALSVQPEPVDDMSEGRMIWQRGKFEMTGSLIRAAQDEEEKEKTKTEDGKMQEASSGMSVEKRELVSNTEEVKEKLQPSILAQAPAVRQTSGGSNQQLESTAEQTETRRAQHEQLKTDQTELLEPKTEKLLKLHQMETEVEESGLQRESSADTEHPSQTRKMSEELLASTEVTAPVSREEVPPTGSESETMENTEKGWSEESSADSQRESTGREQVEAEPSAQVTTHENETFSSPELLAETKAPTEWSPSEQKEEDVVEVVTGCGCEEQTVVEVTTVNKEELQTQVQLDLQYVTDAKTWVPEGDKPQESWTEEGVADEQSERAAEAAAADQAPEVKTEISSDVNQPATSEEVATKPYEKHQQQTGNELWQNATDSESNTAKPTPDTSSEMPTGDTGTCVQEVVTVGDEFVLLVPKGQAVEMDIEICQWTERIRKDTSTPPELDHTGEVQAPEPQTEEEPKGLDEKLSTNDLDKEDSLVPVEEDNTEEQNERGLEEGEMVFSPLQSFTPQDDFSEFRDIKSGQVDEQKADIYETENVPETKIPREDSGMCIDERNEDVAQTTEQAEAVLDPPDELVDQLGYEMISEKEAQDMPESETRRDAEEFGLQPEGRMGTETEQREEEFGEDVIEADYEIIDEEEESQARLAAELQGLDWFCSTCERLLPEDEHMSGEHQNHDVKLVEKAYEEVKVRSWRDTVCR